MTVAKCATRCLHALWGSPEETRGVSNEGQALPLSSLFVKEQLEILRTHCD